MANDQNNIPFDVMQMAKNIETFIEKLKNGDGLGLDENQKEEYKKALQQNGALKNFEEAKIKFDELKNKM